MTERRPKNAKSEAIYAAWKALAAVDSDFLTDAEFRKLTDCQDMLEGAFQRSREVYG